MRIIRQFGSSEISYTKNADNIYAPQRTIEGKESSLKDFLDKQPKFHISQWISVIDKIYQKPKNKDITEKSSGNVVPLGKEDFYIKRQELGQACLKLLVKNIKISDDKNDNEHKKFLARIHPYLQNLETPEKYFIAPNKIPKYQGRWYHAFVAPNDTADDTALKIQNHLYHQASNRQGKEYSGQKGLIAHKQSAASQSGYPIEKEHRKNILTKIQQLEKATINSDNIVMWYQYKLNTRNYDVISEIFTHYNNKYIEKEKSKDAKGCLSVAMQALHTHWGKIFPSAENHAEARDQKLALYNLHKAIKEYYKRLIKRGDNRLGNLVKRLPKNAAEMHKQLSNIKQNSDVSFYIRQGKILHYSLNIKKDKKDEKDETYFSPLNQSKFYTAQGQHEIKQNEAFVKVWLTAITSATRTIQNLIDPHKQLSNIIKPNEKGIKKDDLLIACLKKNYDKGIKKSLFKDNYTPQGEKVFENVIDYEHVKKQFAFLFGKTAQDYQSTESLKEIIILLLKLLPELRNNAFHFKGFEDFFSTTMSKEYDHKKEKKTNISGTQKNEFAKKLYNSDQISSFERIYSKFEAVKCNHYFQKDFVQKICTLIHDHSDNNLLPLPKFSRVLQRAENNKIEGLIPSPSQQIFDQDDFLKMQYTVLKELYDKPFRSWAGTQKIKDICQKIIEQTTQKAQTMNGTTTPEILLCAKIGKTLETYDFSKNNTLSQLFYDLTKATAQESQVQKGYESDGDNARAQAEYIENFKCDIIAHLFSNYITQHNLNDLVSDKANKRENGYFIFKNLSKNALPSNLLETQIWHANLYLILHLIPIEEVNQLLHQLRKWLVVSQKTNCDAEHLETTKQIANIMVLYADMHDAKFIDNQHIDAKYAEIFKQCYESETVFNTIFQVNDTSKSDKLLPIRGLREIMRYGDMNVPFIKTIFKEPVPHNILSQWETLETKIADAQLEKKRLHKKWVDNTKLNETDTQNYKDYVATISAHTDLKKLLYLIDHKNLHRLLMQVLGRLVGFAHHFERDWYFITLAVCYEHYQADQTKPDNPFKAYLGDAGFTELKKGKINSVFNNNDNFIKTDVEKLIPFNKVEHIRDNIAHFNMLKKVNMLKKASFSITEQVNETRNLMAYDRKMKNSVAKSIQALLERENIMLEWEPNKKDKHQLQIKVKEKTDIKESVRSKDIKHLGANKNKTSHESDITQQAHSNAFIAMVRQII